MGFKVQTVSIPTCGWLLLLGDGAETKIPMVSAGECSSNATRLSSRILRWTELLYAFNSDAYWLLFVSHSFYWKPWSASRALRFHLA